MSACAACTELREKVTTLEWRVGKLIEEHDLAEQDIAHKRRQIAALKQKLDEKREQEPTGQEAQDVFDYWLVACRKDPARTKLNHKRLQAIRKALQEGYTVGDIQRATEGLAWAAFEKDGVRYDDISVACRNVELYRDKADAAEARQDAQRAEVGEQARKLLIDETRPHYSKPHLPALWAGGFEAFASALQMKGCKIVGGQGNKLMAQCPAHDDRNPSLRVTEADDGRVLAKCHAQGCTWEQICAALNVDPKVFGPRGDVHPYGKPTDNGQQISFA